MLFRSFCNQERGLSIFAGVNFEYDYPLKTKVMKFILAHFEKDIRGFEERHENLMRKIWTQKFRALCKYTRW